MLVHGATTSGAGVGGGTRRLVVELGGAVGAPVGRVQPPGRPPQPPAGPVRPSGGRVSPGGRVWAPTCGAHQGACRARRGVCRGGDPPSPPFVAPGGASRTTGGGVPHLTGLALGVRNRLRDPSRSSGRSVLALGGPEDDGGEPSGGPGGPDAPPPRGLCPPGAALDEAHLLPEPPQQRCSPRRGPFVGLADAVGGPRGRPGRPSGGPAPPLPTPSTTTTRSVGPSTPRKPPLSVQRPPHAVRVPTGSAP